MTAKLWAHFLAWLTKGSQEDAEEYEKKINEKMKGKIEEVKRTERGWGGHFIGAYDCLYHRNTLLEYGDKKVVVSTVGRYFPLHKRKERKSMIIPNESFEIIGLDRYFETMAFEAYESEPGYWDANVGKEVSFNSNWQLDRPDMEKEADEMHEAVVAELTHDLINETLTIIDYGAF